MMKLKRIKIAPGQYRVGSYYVFRDEASMDEFDNLSDVLWGVIKMTDAERIGLERVGLPDCQSEFDTLGEAVEYVEYIEGLG